MNAAADRPEGADPVPGRSIPSRGGVPQTVGRQQARSPRRHRRRPVHSCRLPGIAFPLFPPPWFLRSCRQLFDDPPPGPSSIPRQACPGSVRASPQSADPCGEAAEQLRNRESYLDRLTDCLTLLRPVPRRRGSRFAADIARAHAARQNQGRLTSTLHVIAQSQEQSGE